MRNKPNKYVFAALVIVAIGYFALKYKAHPYEILAPLALAVAAWLFIFVIRKGSQKRGS
jgi:hypothetical protein